MFFSEIEESASGSVLSGERIIGSGVKLHPNRKEEVNQQAEGFFGWRNARIRIWYAGVSDSA